MLAALRFLHNYLLFWAVPIADSSKDHLDYTDSQSLLKQLSSSTSRYYDSPGACLKSEFDLETAILATFKALPLKMHTRTTSSPTSSNSAGRRSSISSVIASPPASSPSAQWKFP
jgi:hypothetical protein